MTCHLHISRHEFGKTSEMHRLNSFDSIYTLNTSPPMSRIIFFTLIK